RGDVHAELLEVSGRADTEDVDEGVLGVRLADGVEVILHVLVAPARAAEVAVRRAVGEEDDEAVVLLPQRQRDPVAPPRPAPPPPGGRVGAAWSALFFFSRVAGWGVSRHCVDEQS